jgi:hypothetical protein
MALCDPLDQVRLLRPSRRRVTSPSADAFGSTIDARDLPRDCKPPYRGRTIWEGQHREWRIVVRRLENDPAPHIVVSGHGPDGRFYSHAAREEGATPATVRQWVDRLIASVPAA